MEAARGLLHQAGDELLRAQGIRHGLEAPGEGQDEDGRHHGLEALRDAFHDLPEGERPAAEVEEDRQNQRYGAAQHQAHRGVRIREGLDEGGAGEEAAGIDHADDAGYDQHDDRQNEIDDLSFRFRLLGLVGIGAPAGEDVAVLDRVPLVLRHGAVVHLRKRQNDHHDDGQDRVKVEGNRLDEEVQPVAVLHIAGYRGRPGGDRGDDAHRRRRRVDHVGQLRPADPVLVAYRAHDGADRQAVEIVVDEDEHAEADGRQLRARACADPLPRPAPEGRGAAGPIHDADHGAEDHQEDQDAHVVGIRQGGHDAVVEDVQERALETEGGVQEAARQDADEEGGIDLLRDEREGDGDHRGEQRPGRLEESGNGRVRSFSRLGGLGGFFREGGQDGECREEEQQDERGPSQSGSVHIRLSFSV